MDEFSGGLPQAYYGTCVSQFPNFFIMMGPNTATGHVSVIYTTECQINFTLRAIRPILQALYPSALSSLSPLNPLKGKGPDTVAVTADAERRENEWIQTEAKRFVWATGCTAWHVDTKTGRNFLLYPDWQWKYWLRSIFIPFKKDFVFTTSAVRLVGRNRKERNSYKTSTLVASGVGIALVLVLVGKYLDMNASNVRDLVLRRNRDLVETVRNIAGCVLVK